MIKSYSWKVGDPPPDALTVDIWWLIDWWEMVHGRMLRYEGCDCGLKEAQDGERDMMMHMQTCAVHGIYADVCRDLDFWPGGYGR